MPKVDLAYTDEESKKFSSCCEVPGDYKGPKYPWGLEVVFEDETLKKLGKSASDFKIGEEVEMPVTMRIRRLSADEREDGEPNESVGLVITSIDVPASNGDRAKKLFGDDE